MNQTKFTCPKCSKVSFSPICLFCTQSILSFKEFLDDINHSLPSLPPTMVASDRFPEEAEKIIISKPQCTLGRASKNDIALSKDLSVSRYHARILFEDGNYVIEDIGSRNGLAVNGIDVVDRAQLTDGCVLSLGMSRFRFMLETIANDIVGVLLPINDDKDLLGKAQKLGERIMDNNNTAHKTQGQQELPPAVDTAATEVVASDLSEPAAPAKLAVQEIMDLVRVGSHKTTSDKVLDSPKKWYCQYFRAELEPLFKELALLNEEALEIRTKIQEVEGRIALMEGLRDCLLTAQGEELIRASKNVLELLGWVVKYDSSVAQELNLTWGDKTEAIARIAWSKTQATRYDLGPLMVSKVNYWMEHGEDVKGILILAVNSEQRPPQSYEECFGEELIQQAKKLDICLMTTFQLLSIYRDLELGNAETQVLRASILAGNGPLAGFALQLNKELLVA